MFRRLSALCLFTLLVHPALATEYNFPYGSEDWCETAVELARRQPPEQMDCTGIAVLTKPSVIMDYANRYPFTAVKRDHWQDAHNEAFVYAMAKKVGLSVAAPAFFAKKIDHRRQEVDYCIFEKFVRVYGQNAPGLALPQLRSALEPVIHPCGALTLYRLIHDEKRPVSTEDLRVIISSISRQSYEEIYVLAVMACLQHKQARDIVLQLNNDGLLDLISIDHQQSLGSTTAHQILTELPHSDFPFSERMRRLLTEFSEQRFESLLTEDPILENTSANKGKILNKYRLFRAMVLNHPDFTIRQIHERAFLFDGLLNPHENRSAYISQGHFNLRFHISDVHTDCLQPVQDVVLLDKAYEGVTRTQNSFMGNQANSDLFSSMLNLNRIILAYGHEAYYEVFVPIVREDPTFVLAFIENPKAACQQMNEKMLAYTTAKANALNDWTPPAEERQRQEERKKQKKDTPLL